MQRMTIRELAFRYRHPERERLRGERMSASTTMIAEDGFRRQAARRQNGGCTAAWRTIIVPELRHPRARRGRRHGERASAATARMGWEPLLRQRPRRERRREVTTTAGTARSGGERLLDRPLRGK